MSICTFNLSTSLDLVRFWGLATRRRSVISPRVNFPCWVTDPVLSDWWIRKFTHIYCTHIYPETWIIHVIHTLFLAGIKKNCPHNLSTRFYAWNLLNFWRYTEAVLDIQMFNKGRVNTRDMCQYHGSYNLPWCQPEWPGSHQVDCCSPSVHPLWLRNRQVNTLFSWHPDGCWNYIILYPIKLLKIHTCRAFKMLQMASGQLHSVRNTVPNCIFAAQISIFFSIKDAEQVQWFAVADPRKSKGYSLLAWNWCQVLNWTAIV